MEKKLKVLVGIDSYFPHVDGVNNCMDNYIKNYGDDVKAVAVAPKHGKYVDSLPYEIHRCKSMFIPFLKQAYGFPKLDKKFKKEVESQDYDIIHIHSPFGMCKYLIGLAKRKNIPIVGTFHTNFRPIFKQILKANVFAEAVVKNIGATYNQLDEVFVCSDGVERQALSFGVTQKISYMPFGTELEIPADVSPLIEKANESFNLDKNENVFIFVGRLMKLKRLDFIVKALKIVKDKGYKFRFFIVGKGMEEELIKSLVKKLELENEVIFTGFLERERMPLLYARASLLLFPSLYDNFALTKVEAATYSTAGLFIRGSNTACGTVEGENAVLADDTIEDFAEKIIWAIENKQQVEKIGVNAKEQLYCSWKSAAEQVVEAYKRIIDEFKIRQAEKGEEALNTKKKTLKKKRKAYAKSKG